MSKQNPRSNARDLMSHWVDRELTPREAMIRPTMDIDEEHQRILRENATVHKPVALPVFQPMESLLDSPGAAAFLVSDSEVSFLSSNEDSEMLSTNKEFLGGFIDYVKKARDMESWNGSEGELRGSELDGLSSGELPRDAWRNVRVSTTNLLREEATPESEGEFDPAQIFNVR